MKKSHYDGIVVDEDIRWKITYLLEGMQILILHTEPESKVLFVIR